MKKLLFVLGLCMIVLSSFVSAVTVHYWEKNVMDTKSWSCGAGSTDSQIYFDSTSWCRSYWQIQGIPTNMTNVHSAVLQFEYNSGSGGQSATTTVYNLSASQMETGSWSLATATCGNTKESLTGSCANNPSIATLSLTGSASSGNPDELNLTNYFNSRISSGVTLDTNMTHTWDSGTIANNYNGGSTGTIKIYYTINLAPSTPSPSLVSVDGSNNTEADLNCSATITDPDGDSMNVSVEWFNNSVLMTSYSLNNNYANGTTISHIFGSGNFSLSNIGDNIVCSMRATDGSATSDWGNSTNLTLLESPPNPPNSIEATFLGEPLTATNPASITFPINFSAIYSSPYSTDGNLVVCSNDASDYDSCSILCESDNVTSGSRASCEYTPTTGVFERIAYFFSHGSWSESSNTTYYVTSKSGDIPTAKINSSPFFINTSLSATDENPYNFSCAANSVCTYTYVVQVSDIAGYGNYTIFAYDDNGNAEYNNETIEVSSLGRNPSIITNLTNYSYIDWYELTFDVNLTLESDWNETPECSIQDNVSWVSCSPVNVSVPLSSNETTFTCTASEVNTGVVNMYANCTSSSWEINSSIYNITINADSNPTVATNLTSYAPNVTTRLFNVNVSGFNWTSAPSCTFNYNDTGLSCQDVDLTTTGIYIGETHEATSTCTVLQSMNRTFSIYTTCNTSLYTVNSTTYELNVTYTSPYYGINTNLTDYTEIRWPNLNFSVNVSLGENWNETPQCSLQDNVSWVDCNPKYNTVSLDTNYTEVECVAQERNIGVVSFYANCTSSSIDVNSQFYILNVTADALPQIDTNITNITDYLLQGASFNITGYNVSQNLTCGVTVNESGLTCTQSYLDMSDLSYKSYNTTTCTPDYVQEAYYDVFVNCNDTVYSDINSTTYTIYVDANSNPNMTMNLSGTLTDYLLDGIDVLITEENWYEQATCSLQLNDTGLTCNTTIIDQGQNGVIQCVPDYIQEKGYAANITCDGTLYTNINSTQTFEFIIDANSRPNMTTNLSGQINDYALSGFDVLVSEENWYEQATCALVLNDTGLTCNTTIIDQGQNGVISCTPDYVQTKGYDVNVTCSGATYTNINSTQSFVFTLNADSYPDNIYDNTTAYDFLLEGFDRSVSGKNWYQQPTCTIQTNDSNLVCSDVTLSSIPEPGIICYQETATVSTACGGLSTGAYYQTDGDDNWRDGDWDTRTSAGISQTIVFYVNYTIPGNALNAIHQGRYDPQAPGGKTLDCWNTTEWKNIYTYTSGYENVSIPNDCFINPIQERITIVSDGYYEEAMYWNITANITYQGLSTCTPQTISEGDYAVDVNCSSTNYLDINSSETYILSVDANSNPNMTTNLTGTYDLPSLETFDVLIGEENWYEQATCALILNDTGLTCNNTLIDQGQDGVISCTPDYLQEKDYSASVNCNGTLYLNVNSTQSYTFTVDASSNPSVVSNISSSYTDLTSNGFSINVSYYNWTEPSVICQFVWNDSAVRCEDVNATSNGATNCSTTEYFKNGTFEMYAQCDGTLYTDINSTTYTVNIIQTNLTTTYEQYITPKYPVSTSDLDCSFNITNLYNESQRTDVGVVWYNSTDNSTWTQVTDYYYTFEDVTKGLLYTTSAGQGQVTQELANYSYWKCEINITSLGYTDYSNASEEANVFPLENLTINAPADWYISNQPLNVNFSVTDYDNMINCSLNVNDATRNTSYNLDTNTNYNITYLPTTDGNQTWNMSCVAPGTSTPIYSPNRLFMYDTNGPTFSGYADNSSASYPEIGDTIALNVTVDDLYTIDYCQLYINSTGTFVNYKNYSVDTNITTVLQMNYSLTGLTPPYQNMMYWYVLCNDSVNNQNTSVTQSFSVESLIPPNITLNPNNAFNKSNVTFDKYTDILVLNITVQDNLNLYSFNLTIKNSSDDTKLNYYNGSLSGTTSFTYTNNVDTSSWNNGNFTVYAVVRESSSGGNIANESYKFLKSSVTVVSRVDTQNGVPPTAEYTLLGYCNITDYFDSSVQMNYTWYNGSTIYASTFVNSDSGEININNVSADTISVGDNWTLQCDGYTVKDNTSTGEYYSRVNITLLNVQTGEQVVNGSINISGGYNVLTNATSTLILPKGDYTANVTVSGYVPSSESFTIYYSPQTLTFNLAFNATFVLLDEVTNEAFNLSSADSIELQMYCPTETISYDITAQNSTLPIPCQYDKFKFIVLKGTTSYYRTFILDPTELLNLKVYLINLDTTTSLFITFALDDIFSNYDNPSVYVKKKIANETVQITADFADLENKVGAYLVENSEYTVEVHSDNQPTKSMGNIIADIAGTKTLRLYSIGIGTNTTAYPTDGINSYLGNISDQYFAYAIVNLTENDSISWYVYDDITNGTLLYSTSTYGNSVEFSYNVTDIINTSNIISVIKVGTSTDVYPWVLQYLESSFNLGVKEYYSTNVWNWAILIILSVISLYATIRSGNIISLVLVGVAGLLVTLKLFTISGAIVAVAGLVSLVSLLNSRGDLR